MHPSDPIENVALKSEPINTEAQHQAALAQIELIFDAKPGTAKGDDLAELVALVEAYEEIAYPIDLPDPIAAAQFRKGQQSGKPM